MERQHKNHPSTHIRDLDSSSSVIMAPREVSNSGWVGEVTRPQAQTDPWKGSPSIS